MTFLELLRRRISLDGARPLITCYDAAGARTELSAVTYGNWVAKTANLILWTVDAGIGDRIALPVATHHPAHWMSLVWIGACWSSGPEAVLTPDEETVAVVSGPELDFGDLNAHRLACSLHPLGLGFAAGLPAGVTDWADVVKGEGDEFPGDDPVPEDVAWQGRTMAEVLSVDPTDARVLIDARGPLDPLAVVQAAVVAPLLGGGSAVTVLGGDPAAIADAEHAEAITV